MTPFLAAGRRILLVLLAVAGIFAGWLYWQAPSLNELRPQLESYLARQLGLKELHLGHLSWRWAGHVWLNAESITFVGAEQRISVDDAQLAVQLSGFDLLRGEVRPTSIRLQHGRIALHIPKAASGEAFPLPAGVLRIEDSSVQLSYGGLSNRFEHLDLVLDAGKRTLGLRMPGFDLDVAWNERLQPAHMHARFDNLRWLPEAWQQSLTGPFLASLNLDKADTANDWNLSAEIQGGPDASLLAGQGAARVQLDGLRIRALVHSGESPLDVQSIEWQELMLASAGNSLTAHGAWQDGVLNMQADAADVNLATLAAVAIPLAPVDMHDWLAGLAGKVETFHADLQLDQATAMSPPGLPPLSQGRVRVEASLVGARLPLVTPGEELEDYNGIVKLDGNGLLFSASSMQLPLGAGKVQGTAMIADFEHPVFDIKGKGRLEIRHLQDWMQVNPLPQVVWKDAPAEAQFELAWPMFALGPDSGDADLQPAPAWQTEVFGRAVEMRGGNLHWKAGSGLRFTGMDLDYEGLTGNFDLALSEAGETGIQILGARLESGGDFAVLASRFRMPIDEPQGRYALSLHFDEQPKESPWAFELDLAQAGWKSLLGSAKQIGEDYALLGKGARKGDVFSISRLHSRGKAMPFVSGSGKLSASLATFRLQALQAAAFSGSMSMHLPLGERGNEPLQIDVACDFLDQRALPKELPKLSSIRTESGPAKKGRPWVLNGRFDRIHWDAVSIRGVQVHFASAEEGVGKLEAEALDAAQFSMREVSAYFELGSGGRVDVRHLGAKAMGQQMNLSGILQPQSGGGLRWTGFADISGDFSQVIQRLDASQLFDGGTVHAQWSGSGVVREDAPWWNDMQGRLRLRSDDGRILEGGTMTKLLAALSLADLPGFLTGDRKDMSGPGMLYKRLQLEASVLGEQAKIRRLAMRASALDMAGKGELNLADGIIDLYVVAQPLQNLDKLLGMIPLLRDVILGPAKSVFRKVYRVHGPLHDAKVEAVSAEQAGLPESGLLEQLLNVPGRWFDAGKKAVEGASPTLP